MKKNSTEYSNFKRAMAKMEYKNKKEEEERKARKAEKAAKKE